MVRVRLFTPTQAAVLTGADVRFIYTAIQRGVLAAGPPRGVDASGAPKRRLALVDLVKLKLWRACSVMRFADTREQVFAALDRDPDLAEVRIEALLWVDVAQARREVLDRIADLDRVDAAITLDAQGEAVFKDARIPVYSLSAHLNGAQTLADLERVFPGLEPWMASLTPLWTLAHPRPKRPPKRLSAARAAVASHSLAGARRPPLAAKPQARGRRPDEAVIALSAAKPARGGLFIDP
jgi:hypothetical protein